MPSKSAGEANAVGWFEAELDRPQLEAVEVVTQALKAEGFGVLTRIDLHDAFKEKLDVEFRPYTILGACNPQLAHAALTESPEIGLSLPCNVTVEELDEGRTRVRIVDPKAILASTETQGSDGLARVAADAQARLRRVAAALRDDRA